jgi:hypothetical protein
VGSGGDHSGGAALGHVRGVWYGHPELRHVEFYSARDLENRWDGATLEQRPTFVRRLLRLKARLGLASPADVTAYLAALPPEARVPAAELWIWDAPSKRARRATAPFQYRAPPDS